MYSRVVLVGTDVSEEHIASIFRVKIKELNRLAIVSDCSTLQRINKKTKQIPWPIVRNWTIPTEWLPIVDEIFSANFCG
jgi:hypothetical protein